MPEPEAALAAGILLGVRSGIDPAVTDAFARAGLTHVVAISGWNIAIVAALAARATRPLCASPEGAGGATRLGRGGVRLRMLTGASPSVVRAGLMAGACWWRGWGIASARVRADARRAGHAAGCAAALWDVGFQLSALATAGLIWFGAGLEARLAVVPALVREPVALTMAAQLTTLPSSCSTSNAFADRARRKRAGGAARPGGDADRRTCRPDRLPRWCRARRRGGGRLAAAGGWLLRPLIVVGRSGSVPIASVVWPPGWLAVAWYPALGLLTLRAPRDGTLTVRGMASLGAP